MIINLTKKTANCNLEKINVFNYLFSNSFMKITTFNKVTILMRPQAGSNQEF